MGSRGPTTDYSEEIAEAFCSALRSGKRPAWAAASIGVHRGTVYKWRNEFESFREAWSEAADYASEKLEGLLYEMASEGNLDAIKYYLRHNKPLQYDRDNLIRLAMLQAQLATRGRTTDSFKFEIDENGLPTSVPISEITQTRRVLILPDNGRSQARPVPTASESAPGAFVDQTAPQDLS
jgi:transposase-like protein